MVATLVSLLELLSLPLLAGLAFAAGSADDVCLPTADPCVITSTIDVDDGAVLDFGTRKIQINSGGKLDIGNGSATIRCGGFSTNVGNLATVIDLRGPNGFGGTDGGDLTLEARRACSGDTATTCLDHGDCALGLCDTMTCSGEPTHRCTGESGCQLGPCIPRGCSVDPRKLCQTDANCELGPCKATRRCTGDNATYCLVDADCNLGTCSVLACANDSRRGCTVNADCDLGACSLQVCYDEISRECSVDGDCDLGTCSVGTAAININGRILGQGENAGILSITAADDLEFSNNINVNGTTIDSDGGTVELESVFGDVLMAGNLKAESGGNGTGGDICVIAGNDIVVGALVDANGGDFDGGTIELDAGGDILVQDDLTADATSGEGFGGEVTLDAGGDIDLVGVGTLNKTTLTANGHKTTDGGASGGDGGPHDLSAGGNLTVGRYAEIVSDGAAPDGFGEVIALDAGGDVVVAGKLEAKARGGQGGGGGVDITADGNVSVLQTASIDVSGAAGDGGAVSIAASGDLLFDGSADLTAANGGTADAFELDGEGDMTIGPNAAVTMSGTAAGNGNGTVDVTGCRMVVQSGAQLNNGGDFTANEFTIRENITFEAGTTVTADATTGSNVLRYRSAAKPPVRLGTITPAPQLLLDPTLPPCPVCGNGDLELGETCDDGNTTASDGCSADCQDEGCIADTPPPGYPDVALCDDGSACTVDSCDAMAGACVHVVSCDDGIACTIDGCGDGGACSNLPSDVLCDDGNPCTDDTCSVAAAGCLSVANSLPCDDGIACTSDDICSAGICAGTSNCMPGQSCDHDSGQCVGGTTTSTTTTSTSTTTSTTTTSSTTTSSSTTTTSTTTTSTTTTSTTTTSTTTTSTTTTSTTTTSSTITTTSTSTTMPPTTTSTTTMTSTTSTTSTTMPAGCGDGIVTPPEQCDDGNTTWLPGQSCRADCTLVDCADPDDNGSTSASDALFVLRAAVGASFCDPCLCDLDASGGNANASDALRCLRRAVGIQVTISCPVCAP